MELVMSSPEDAAQSLNRVQHVVVTHENELKLCCSHVDFKC